MNNSTKNIIIGVLVLAVVGITIAYAALSSQLKITGTANVTSTTWDVKLKNLAAATNVASLISGQTNTGTAGTIPSISNGTQISGLTATLNQPGDVVKFTFKIANEGTIDAKLSSFSDSLTRSSGASMTQDQINARFSKSLVCDPTQGSTSDYLNKAGSTAGNNHDVANCTLTIAWKEAVLGSTGQTSQTAGQDQTFTQGAIVLSYNATWLYTQK